MPTYFVDRYVVTTLSLFNGDPVIILQRRAPSEQIKKEKKKKKINDISSVLLSVRELLANPLARQGDNSGHFFTLCLSLLGAGPFYGLSFLFFFSLSF